MTGIKVKMGTPKEEVEVAEEAPEEEVVPEVVSEDTETVVLDEEADLPNVELEDLDPNEDFWDGGPKVGKVQKWKKEHKSIYVTAVTADVFVIWRTLSRPEYREYMEQVEEVTRTGQVAPSMAQMMVEETISDICMLFPTYEDAMEDGGLAGLPATISQQCLEASGFVALETRRL